MDIHTYVVSGLALGIFIGSVAATVHLIIDTIFAVTLGES